MIDRLIKRSGLALFFCLHGILLPGQVDSGQVHTSPYTVIYNHLYYLQGDSYDPARAALSFPTDRETGKTRAIQLKQVLDGLGLYVDMNRLPTSRRYTDSTTQEALYFIDRDVPLIYVERIDSNWYYSRTTLEAIPALHRKVFPFGARLAVLFQAPFWQMRWFQIHLWKWLGLLVLCLLAIGLFRLIRWVGHRTLTPLLKKHLDLDAGISHAVRRFSHLLGFWLGLHFFRFLLPTIQLPVRINALLMTGLYLLSAFFIIFMANQLVRILFIKLKQISKTTGSTLDDQFMPLLRRLAFIVVWVAGTFYILDYLDVNVTALLAGISIGGLAIALAAQDTVKNFFGSIMIFLDKPFQIGDYIKFKDVGGVVEEVGVRSTRIRTFANSLTYVPNGMLADQIIDNMGLRVYRLYKTEIGVTYDTPPAVIDQFVQGIRTIIEQHPNTRKDFIQVHLTDFGASSLNILVYTFFDVPDYTGEMRSRHELMHAILLLAGDLGVRFAFPSQTLHIESFPDNGSATPPSKPASKTGIILEQSLKKIGRYFERRHQADHR